MTSIARGIHTEEFPRAHHHVVGMLGLRLWHEPTELAHSFLFSSCVCFSVFMALSTVFHSINSPDNSPFSHSVLPVLSLPHRSFQPIHLFMKVSFSPDMIPSGCLGLKTPIHQLPGIPSSYNFCLLGSFDFFFLQFPSIIMWHVTGRVTGIFPVHLMTCISAWCVITYCALWEIEIFFLPPLGRGCSSVGRVPDRHAADSGSVPRCGMGFTFFPRVTF